MLVEDGKPAAGTNPDNEQSTAATAAANQQQMIRRKPNESGKDFWRRRNAVYAKRVYDKKKIEQEVLQQQQTDLSHQNGQLLAEQKRLESLLAQAQNLVSKPNTTTRAT